MKCQNCGEEVPNNFKFCNSCGANIEEQMKRTEQLNQQPVAGVQNGYDTQAVSQQPKKKKPKRWKRLLIGIAIVIGIIVFFNIIGGQTGCKHEWIEATCEKAKTCSVCGATEGAALGHTCETWETVNEATCAKAGLEKGLCSVCSKEVTREIAAKSTHTPGDWVTTKDATVSEAGERQKKCTVCGKVIQTEKIDFSSKENQEEYKAACDSYTYQQIARNPQSYIGKLAKFTGEVIQVIYDEQQGQPVYQLRVNITQEGEYATYYTDTIFVQYYNAAKEDPRILEDDIVTMYGELDGDITYETVMGNDVTIPSFSAKFIDIH